MTPGRSLRLAFLCGLNDKASWPQACFLLRGVVKAFCGVLNRRRDGWILGVGIKLYLGASSGSERLLWDFESSSRRLASRHSAFSCRLFVFAPLMSCAQKGNMEFSSGRWAQQCAACVCVCVSCGFPGLVNALWDLNCASLLLVSVSQRFVLRLLWTEARWHRGLCPDERRRDAQRRFVNVVSCLMGHLSCKWYLVLASLPSLGLASVLRRMSFRGSRIIKYHRQNYSQTKIFAETRTQDCFRVYDLSSCYLLAETDNSALLALLSWLVSELLKTYSPVVEPRRVFGVLVFVSVISSSKQTTLILAPYFRCVYFPRCRKYLQRESESRQLFGLVSFVSAIFFR
jgi:hypothetical protein